MDGEAGFACEIGDEGGAKERIPALRLEDDFRVTEHRLIDIRQDHCAAKISDARDRPEFLSKRRRVIRVRGKDERRGVEATPQRRPGRDGVGRSGNAPCAGRVFDKAIPPDRGGRPISGDDVGVDAGARHKSRFGAVRWVGIFIEPRLHNRCADVRRVSRRVGKQGEGRELTGKIPMGRAQHLLKGRPVFPNEDARLAGTFFCVAYSSFPAHGVEGFVHYVGRGIAHSTLANSPKWRFAAFSYALDASSTVLKYPSPISFPLTLMLAIYLFFLL